MIATRSNLRNHAGSNQGVQHEPRRSYDIPSLTPDVSFVFPNVIPRGPVTSRRSYDTPEVLRQMSPKGSKPTPGGPMTSWRSDGIPEVVGKSLSYDIPRSSLCPICFIGSPGCHRTSREITSDARSLGCHKTSDYFDMQATPPIIVAKDKDASWDQRNHPGNYVPRSPMTSLRS